MVNFATTEELYLLLDDIRDKYISLTLQSRNTREFESQAKNIHIIEGLIKDIKRY